MLKIYPEKKGTITRLQNLERKQFLEFIRRKKYNEEHHIIRAAPLEPESLDICIPLDCYPNMSETIKARIEASGLGPVKITDEYMEFDWFPYTLVRAQCDLCGEFIQWVIHLALQNKL